MINASMTLWDATLLGAALSCGWHLVTFGGEAFGELLAAIIIRLRK